MSNLDAMARTSGRAQVTLFAKSGTPLSGGAVGATAVVTTTDPAIRNVVDTRYMRMVRMWAELGGPIVAANKLRLQYNVDPAASVGDAGWTTLQDSAGGHTTVVPFLTNKVFLPNAARSEATAFRVVFFDGNGAAVPTLTRADLIFGSL